MAMGWLKGLVAPAAQFGSSQEAPPGAMPGAGGPPIGGAPQAYGAPGAPAMPQPSPPNVQAYDAATLPNAMQWSTGTKTVGGGAGASPAGAGLGGAGAGAAASANAGSLEARCAQLEHDIHSLALFARTLLTMLEDNKLVTREQFDATKHRLDMMDGKLDDR